MGRHGSLGQDGRRRRLAALGVRGCATVAAVGLVPVALAGSASAAGYHSPGYRGTKSFRNVTPAPLAPIGLGTGKRPSLLVDGAGTAHIVFARDGGSSAPDALSFCNLQRGIKRCASGGTAPNPEAPDPSQGGIFIGNFPAGNHDFDGPAPLVIGNQLFVVDRRFPDFFSTPGGGQSDSNVFVWSSADGGATLTGPGQIGDNQMAGGAVAFGDPGAPSIGTISRTQTEGTFFQGSPSGQYTTAKAQLGTNDQDQDGSIALDGDRPVAAFADLSGNVLVREWSGQGDPNDAGNWSQSSFRGFSPQIVGGAAGVFVLYSDSRIGGGRLRLRRIVGGQPGAVTASLGRSSGDPAISEDPTGRIAFAYTDSLGVWVRSSRTGSDFSPPELAARIRKGGSIASLAVAATTDGGGFVSFVRDPVGAEGVGPVIAAAFGTQQATRQPGLGPLPGGGIGSAAGDQLATSTCQVAKFGAVEAKITANCYGHDPRNPNLDVTLGELNLNGLRIIPDPGVRIGIDPRQHTIDTTGKVRVVLSGGGVDITLWHDELHAKLPDAGAGSDLFDLHETAAPLVEGFPIDGDVDIKLVDGGVDIPISLKLPAYFGGVTGSATLHASTTSGLQLRSLEFTVGDANLGALELKDVDVSYTAQGKVWKGEGGLWIPAGGGAVRIRKLAVEFDDGAFKGGSLEVDLPYPGISLDDSDPPPQVWLSNGGLGFNLGPPTLSGTVGVGIIPLLPPGSGTSDDFVFRLRGELSVAFGSPVTITATARGFLRTIELAHSTLTYKLPASVTLTGVGGYDLGLIRFSGQMSAIVDPRAGEFGAQMRTDIFIKAPDPFSDVKLPGFAVAINKRGFGIHVPFPGILIPFPPVAATFFGTVAYQWGDDAPKFFYGQDMTGRFTAGIPQAASAAGRRAHAAAATGFTVPAGAPSTSIVVHGDGGAPRVALTAPGGQQLVLDGKPHSGMSGMAVEDAGARAAYVGITHPRAGRWTVSEADSTPAQISRVEYSVGVRPPSIRATLAGRGFRRAVRSRATVPASAEVTLAERTKKLLHVIGRVRRSAGTIRFRPAFGPAGRRELVAVITNNGLPVRTQVLGSFVVPRPPLPGRARGLRVRAGRRTFTYSFTPPAGAAHVLVRVVATDGRHLQRVVSSRTRRGSVRVIGFRDGITVTVAGIRADGVRGPAVAARARRRT